MIARRGGRWQRNCDRRTIAISAARSRTVKPLAANFATDPRGATAVEFGLVAAPFLAVLFGALQIATLFFSGQALETFTETAGRGILVGTSQAQNYTQAQYKAALCAQLPSLFNCNDLYVDVTTAGSFSAANTGAPTLTFDQYGNVTNIWNYNLGNQGDIVVLRIMYQWSVFGLPLGISFANQSNGSRLLMATAVFQNEVTAN